MLTWEEIENRAVAFQKRWKGCLGDERQGGQTFEKDFMEVFGVDWRDGLHEHQIYLKDGSMGFIDYLLPGKIMIEMKSKGKSLARAYTQAMSYLHALNPEDIPTLLMVCDFDKVEVHNLKKDYVYKPFKVSQLKNHIRIFGELAGYGFEKDREKDEIEVNISASYKMAKIHDELKENGYRGHDLEVYLVRLLFCMFADDSGIFEKGSFEKYIEDSSEDGSDLSMRLMMLFSVLNTSPETRMKNLPDNLKKFRYINGNIFKEALPPASFNAKMRKELLECSKNFNWSRISPAIFGAMFQGIMNQAERRALGAHYTSKENIDKVIGPLFLDELYEEFELSKNTKRELIAFQVKLASLKFLDPACGSGNFLIETYKEIRKLEFEVLKLLHDNQQMTIVDKILKVSPDQFYGIEYEDFPCQIATLSMVLMKHIMDQEVSNYFGVNMIDFPIRENVNIAHANAMEIDWNEVCNLDRLNYIIGNPPFIGARMMSESQKKDITDVLNDEVGASNLDYVAGWYIKASKAIAENRNIKVALVSTNSICQGEQVNILWKPILGEAGCEIDFAYQTFKWGNKAKYNAAVHCVIVGFSSRGGRKRPKLIFTEEGSVIEAGNINGYLANAPNVFIESRSKPICKVPAMSVGNLPIDDGNYLFTKEQMEDFIAREPAAAPYFKAWYGSREFLHKDPRMCLIVKNIPSHEIRSMKHVLERIENVRKFRLSSKRKATVKMAETPMNFHHTMMPDGEYLLIPKVSSEKRRYVPIGFMPPSVLCSDLVFVVPNADLYHFGVLTSNAHNAFMRMVAGRLKSDYRYSSQLVYNNFPWPDADQGQIEKIKKTAAAILDARSLDPDTSYADLYDPLTMSDELRKAHQANDKAVWEAYGKKWDISSEVECLSYLMTYYEELKPSNSST